MVNEVMNICIQYTQVASNIDSCDDNCICCNFWPKVTEDGFDFQLDPSKGNVGSIFSTHVAILR